MRSLIRSTGVSLVEMMIGIVILAIALALALPSYNQWIQNTQIRNAAESILRGLQLARSEAISRNVPVQLTLGAGSSWTVGCVTATAICPATIQTRATGEGSSATITITTEGGATQYVFSDLGLMTAPVPGAGSSFTDINVDSTALAAADSRDLRIRITTGGMIRMCDPNVTSTTDTRKC